MTEEPAKRWFQATGIPLPSSPAEHSVEEKGPYISLLDVFLRVQNDLDRTVHVHRDLDARVRRQPRGRRPNRHPADGMDHHLPKGSPVVFAVAAWTLA